MPFPIHLLKSAAKELAEPAAKVALKWVLSRFTDSSQWTLKAILSANHRTWAAVGLALVEESRFAWARDLLRDGELKAARDAVRQLIDGTPVRGLSADELRRRAAAELEHLQRGAVTTPAEWASAEDALRRYVDPSVLLADADSAACALADAFGADSHLGDVLRLASAGRTPLFAAFYRHFLHARVAKHPEHFGRVILDQLRALTAQTDARTVGILDQLGAIGDAIDDGFATTHAKLDDGFANLGAKVGELQTKLDVFIAEHKVTTSARDPLKVTVTNERDRELLRRWAAELNQFPPELVDSALRSKLGDALAAARMFDEARQAHAAAAKAATDRRTQAEAEFKAYRDACEQEAWTEALSALVRAADLDADRFRPFPFRSYEPVAIVGAGGSGTVIQCRWRNAKGRNVAVKTFHTADLGRDVDDVFAEAHTLKELDHKAIVKVLHWEWTESTEPRPYLVMEYFPGVSLAAHLKQHGRLSVADFFAVARPVAEAMVAAHAANILHRDLKPGNVLVQRSGGYSVRVIDFGLAVRFSAVQASVSTSQPQRTRRDQSFAGTLEYASPEQKGTIAAPVGPRSDVYSFGKTMLEALLGTTEPVTDDWELVPDQYRDPLKRILERCVIRDPSRRHDGFAPIVAALAELDPTEKSNCDRQQREEDARKRAAEELARLEADRERVRAAAEAAEAAEKARRERQQREAEAQRAREEEALRIQREKEAEDERKRKAEEEAKARDPLNPARVREAGEKVKLTLPGDVVMRFAWCPPTSKPFLMGSNHPQGDSDEKPAHKVTLTTGFFIGIHQVTQAQWKAIMGTEPSHFKGPNRPVENVSWDDCQEFCTKLSAHMKGRVKVRLPTEAEWEYACRAGTTTEYHFGDVIDPTLANYDGNYSWNGSPKGEYREQTTDVGSFPANPWGLYDMHGNVWEWCQDAKRTYTEADQTDPQSQSNEGSRVVRGGSWCSYPDYCRAANRSWDVRGTRDFYLGFRVAFRLD
jgi:formylglycine-generating enzyme required for sulfatase activity